MCIVGAGVMGTSAAYWLSKTQRMKILLLDRYGVGNEYCSSNDYNRVFRFAYGKDEFYTRMAVESLRLWKTLEKLTRTRLLIPSGLLMLEGTDVDARGFNDESYNTLTRLGLGTERISGTLLKRRFPQFKADSAILDLHGGVLLASRTLELFTVMARRQGVDILERRVTKVIPGNHPTLETSTGEQVKCQKAIITVGAWSNNLRTGRQPTVTPFRQQVAYFRPQGNIELFRPGSFPVFFTDHHYGLPAVGIDGVKISNKRLPLSIDPEQADRTIDREEVEACRSACERCIPGLAKADLVHAKTCMYDMTGNSDFVIGPDPETTDVIYGFGFSGHGFKFAPLVGKLLSEIALERRPSFETERLSPATNHETAPTRPY